MIRIFRVDPMKWTLFEDDNVPEAFRRIGASYVADPLDADVMIGSAAHELRRFGRLPKRFAVWTHEPRYDLHIRTPVAIPGIVNPVHIMNIHVGGVFADNYAFMGEHGVPLDRDGAMREFASKPWRAGMLATYRRQRNRLRWAITSRFRVRDRQASLIANADGSLMRDGRNLDLYQHRQALGLYLLGRGFCDIYGRKWPRRVPISGESRFDNWKTTKQTILKNYAINIAFENAIVTHYVTEKIWDAIKAACLPVYHGAENGIYDDFPEGSFIEAAGKTTEALADEIMTMNRREAADRYEVCLDVYQRIVGDGRRQASMQAMDRRTADFLENVMNQPLSVRN